ncbi:hypothetical protein RB195_006527 [Necator americanus]|uniref:C2H2-type domain-containing protein n=1 Tax=Necator americanus TaxID=51031 RepID=A0ABR1BT17_NECAM
MEPCKPPCLLLPTVCVNGERSSTNPTGPLPLSPPATFEIVSPKPRVPVTSNAVIFHRWYAYRDERTSSSSSDSGVASLQFSPPHLLTVGTSMGSAVMALSPPGLSPLHVQDSAFSTPTPSSATTSTSRFTFDHIPYLKTSDQFGNSEITSAFDLPSSSGKDPERLKDILKTVRRQEDVKGHPILQRKESVIHSTRKSEATPSTVGRTESLPIPQKYGHQLSVSVPDTPLDKAYSGPASFLLFTSSGHSLVSPSLSSPLSSSESYRLTASPSYIGLSPTPRTDCNSTSEVQKSPASLSSECAGDDDDKKQYYCNICKKDFKRPDILSRHLRRHTGEKPFGCDACGRYFSRSDHLRTHRRTHTDEKPYQCTICPYAARRRDVLTRHMSTRHQAKAGLSVFQKHRDIRRCLSDGDHALLPSSSRPEPSTPKRIRHTTDISPVREQPEQRDRTITEQVTARDRRITETLQEGIPTSLTEVEDDVIVDVCELEEEDEEDDDDDVDDEADFDETCILQIVSL